MILKILMISTEYPPMQGGVGRYCKKLVDSLKSEGMQVFVVCNEDGNGDYNGISPNNQDNSKVLLKIVKEVEPDVGMSWRTSPARPHTTTPRTGWRHWSRRTNGAAG